MRRGGDPALAPACPTELVTVKLSIEKSVFEWSQSMLVVKDEPVVHGSVPSSVNGRRDASLLITETLT